MKKSSALVIVIFSFAFIFSGCGLKDNKNNISFIGNVEEVFSQSVLVGSIENSDFDCASVSFHDDAELKFTLRKGQVIKVTALPEVRETYPVGVTAVKVTLISQPSEKDASAVTEYNASFYRIGSVADGFGQIASKAVNSDKFALSSALHLPMFKFDSKAQFDSFIEETKSIFDFDFNEGSDETFNQAITKYDDAFFKDNCLLIIYDEEPSGANKLKINNIKTDDKTLTFAIKQIKAETASDNVSSWFIAIDISKKNAASFENFDAYLDMMNQS